MAMTPSSCSPRAVTGRLAGRGDLNVAVVAHTGLEHLVSAASIWRAVPVTEPMMVRWWYEPARALPRSAARRRDWLRLQWAFVDSWIDARKAARHPGRLPGPVAAPEASSRPPEVPA